MSRRWFPRFSLRTLLLLVMLIGSGATLWWRWEPWVPERTLHEREHGYDSWIRSATFSHDNHRIVTASANSVSVWDADTGNLQLELLTDRWTACDAKFSPDGRRIVSTYNDDKIRYWDAQTGSALAMIQADQHEMSVAFSPDGRRIVTTGGLSSRVWDVETHNLLAELNWHHDGLVSSVFSPDGRRIVTVGERGITSKTWVWDPETGKVQVKLRGQKFRSAAFSPDSRRLVTACEDDITRVWDVETGQECLELNAGSKDNVQHAVYSPDGSRILTSDLIGPDEFPLRNHTSRIWAVETGTVLVTLSNSGGSASYSPNGQRIVFVRGDGTISIWHRRRPEYRWGLACLPEFWMTIIFAGAFAWNLWRARARLHAG